MAVAAASMAAGQSLDLTADPAPAGAAASSSNGAAQAAQSGLSSQDAAGSGSGSGAGEEQRSKRPKRAKRDPSLHSNGAASGGTAGRRCRTTEALSRCASDEVAWHKHCLAQTLLRVAHACSRVAYGLNPPMQFETCSLVLARGVQNGAALLQVSGPLMLRWSLVPALPRAASGLSPVLLQVPALCCYDSQPFVITGLSSCAASSLCAVPLKRCCPAPLQTPALCWCDSQPVTAAGLSPEEQEQAGAVQRCQAESLRLLEWPAVCRQVASFSATPMAAEQALAGAIPLADSQAAAELLLQVRLNGIAALPRHGLKKASAALRCFCCTEVRQTSWPAAEVLLQAQRVAGLSWTRSLRPCCFGAVRGLLIGDSRSGAQGWSHWLQNCARKSAALDFIHVADQQPQNQKCYQLWQHMSRRPDHHSCHAQKADAPTQTAHCQHMLREYLSLAYRRQLRHMKRGSTLPASMT